MPLRIINEANSPALEARSDANFAGPDTDLSDFGVTLAEDLNATKRVLAQTDYTRSDPVVRAEMEKVVFLQIRRRRAEEERMES